MKRVLPLFFIIFIDSIGLGIVYPILTPIFLNVHQGILPPTVSIVRREWLYGLCLGLYPLFTFLGAPLLGDLSDFAGRKKVLIICLLGSFVGYLLAGLAVYIHSVPILLLSRIIDGFTSGSQPIAQAAIVDISPAHKKAANLSLMLLALSLGLVFGPMFGGFLSDHRLVSWFNLATPFYFAALLAFVNVYWLQCFFQETSSRAGKIKIKLARGFEVFAAGFKHKTVRFLAIIFLVMQLGWSCYFQYISFYLVRVYHITPRDIGLFFGFLGIGFMIAMAVVMRILVKYFAVKHIAWVSLMVVTGGLLMTYLPQNYLYPWVFGFIIAIASALIYTSMITLFSDQVGEDRQGWVMGISSAIASLAWAIMAFTGGTLGSLPAVAPLVVATILVGASAFLALMYANQLRGLSSKNQRM